MKIQNFLRKNIYAKNIFLAILVIVVLFSGLKWWLNIYTRHGHNQTVVVPDVRGLSIQEATGHFNKCSLNFEIIDSVYNKNVKPGAIVETIPTPGTKVKKHRNILISINAVSARTSIIPDVKGQSLRQAITKLNSVEFKNIQVKYMPEAYKDLVLGLEYQGREIDAGERLPLNSKLVLLVADGSQSVDEFSEDFIETDTGVSVDESWLFN